MRRAGGRAAGLLVLLFVLAALACSAPADPRAAAPRATAVDDDADEDGEGTDWGAKPGSAPTATPRPLATSALGGLKVELIAQGLVLPQSLAFAPDGRLFFVEVKQGALRVLNGTTVQPEPVATIAVARGAEQGLIGLALDPAFERNHYLYTFYTQAQKGNEAGRPRRHRLTRWTERNGVAGEERAILDDLPHGKCCHTGGKLAFAADGSLFLALGDQGDADRQQAQHPTRLNGKLLRLDPSQALSERPDPSTLIWAGGLRNPYGLDVHPVTGAPVLTDNGPDVCDELNLGRAGANWGNPLVECSPRDGRFDDPLWDSGADRLGLTGLRVYRGAMFPELVNQPLFCAVNTGNLMRAVLEGPEYAKVERVEQLIGGQDGEGCRLDLAPAPDGSIYYSSVSKIFRLYR